MARLMVLGGGRHQLPLIERARARGLEVVLVDYLENAPGRRLANHAVLADATDTRRAAEIAAELSVDGVITTGTDQPIRAMAGVAAARGLPSYLDEASAFKATDKEAMWESLASVGVPMAARRVVGPDGPFPDVDFPVVVKPADSQGQRGVSLVGEAAAAAAALNHALSASKTGRAVVEEFLQGPEFTANGWLADGRLALLLVNDRITFNPHPYIGIAYQHRHPSRAAHAHMEEVAAVTERVGQAYGMKDGPLYIQMVTTPSGPVVVEAAARAGGGHESRLLLHLTGWIAEDTLIDLALGDPVTPPPGLPPDAHGLVNFILGRRGVVGETTPGEITGAVPEMSWYVTPGTALDDVTNSLGRVGYFIARADSAPGLEEAADDYYRSLHLEGNDGENLVLVPDRSQLNLP